MKKILFALMLGAVALFCSCKKTNEPDAPLYMNQWIGETKEATFYLSLEDNNKALYGILLTEETLTLLKELAAAESDIPENLKKMLDEAKPNDTAAAECSYNIILNEDGTSGTLAITMLLGDDAKPLTEATTFKELLKDSMTLQGGEEAKDALNLKSASSLGIKAGKNYPEIFTKLMIK